MNFGQAIEELKNGKRLRRQGWNGKGIFLILIDEAKGLKRVGFNGENCDVSLNAHIAIDTTGLETKNSKAPKTVAPWLASQTDMLSEDWEIAK